MLIRGCVSTDVSRAHRNCTDAAVLKIAASTRYGRVAFAFLSDGDEKAECAGQVSALAAERYAEWFHDELPEILQDTEEEIHKRKPRNGRMMTEMLSVADTRRGFNKEMLDLAQTKIRKRLAQITEEVEVKISGYRHLHHVKAACAVTCLLLIDREYLLMRVGRSHAYLTALEGLRHMSPSVKGDGSISFGRKYRTRPVFVRGSICENAGFLLCSDGFCRRQTQDELHKMCLKIAGASERKMQQILRKMTRCVRRRGEQSDAFAIYLSVA